jgi:hypothetical protein
LLTDRNVQVAIKILKFKKSNNKGSDPEVGMKRVSLSIELDKTSRADYSLKRFKREIGVWGVLSQPPQPHILELYGFVKYLGSDALEYPAIISKVSDSHRVNSTNYSTVSVVRQRKRCAVPRDESKHATTKEGPTGTPELLVTKLPLIDNRHWILPRVWRIYILIMSSTVI